MKLIVLLILASLFQVQAESFAQTVSLSKENVSIVEVFREIKKQTNYNIISKSRIIKETPLVSIHLKNVSLEETLDQLLTPYGLSYVIEDNAIIVKKTGPSANETITEAREKVKLQEQVRGIVKDESGEPLVGVNVRLQGKGGVTTNVNGEFIISVEKGETLVFSYIGFLSQEVEYSGQSNLEITLKATTMSMDEVVVVGYGTQKRQNLSGSVATVTSEVFESRPTASVSAALQGALPGVTIQVPSGKPGSEGINISIRGVTTLNSGSDPLVLIDGVEGGGLYMLNPDDIESVTVLKDAASSAIYGARAANGVLLVTTKKGKVNDRPAINYSGYFGYQTPTRLPEMVNGRDFMTLSNEARVNAGLGRLYLDDAFEKYDSGSAPNDYNNTDWINEIYKKGAYQQNHQVNISGGSGKTGYFFSYGLINQDGLIVGNSYDSKRNNIRLRLNTEIFDRLSIDGSLSYSTLDRNDNALSGTAGVFRLAQRISPLLPVYWYDEASGAQTEYFSHGAVNNPVNVAYNSGYDFFKSKTPTGNIMATLKVIDGLKVSSQYALNNSIYRTKEFNDVMLKYYPDGSEDAGNANLRNMITLSESDHLNQTFNTLINFDKKIGDHNLNVLGGYSQEWGFISNIGASRKNILMEGVEQINLGTEDITNSGTEYHWALQSYFGRINYNYKERYLVEANIRHDGTSRFDRRNRWGTFPSFSAAWKISDESFAEFMSPWVDLFKIRASYGRLGNQNVGSSNDYYPYLTSISRVPNSYPIGNVETVGFAQTSLGNIRLIWETIEMKNLGVDIAMFNNRFSLTGDLFVKNNKNALLQPVYPSIIGFTSATALPLVNMGKVESKGWELAATWRDNKGDFSYGINASLSDVNNTVISLGNSKPTLGNSLIREGDPLNAYFGYLTDGLASAEDFESFDPATNKYVKPLFPTINTFTAITQPGDIKYRDISGPDGVPDGIIDNNDRAVFGNQYPRYMYSFRGELGWKNIDFSFFLQGVGKVDGYLYEEAIHPFINDYSIPQNFHMNRWTPQNPGASLPRVYYAQTHNREFSDYWKQDASYLRLKNIQLGYTISNEFLKKVNLGRVRVYVSADNLFTKSNYFYAYDPEVRSTSGDAYPQVKTFVFGLSAKFN